MQATNDKGVEVCWALLVLRIVVGTIFIMHGAYHLFGAFGGLGLAGVMGPQGPGGGGIIGLLVAIGEFWGGLGIMLGVLTRFSAAANIVTMLGAIALVHGSKGFFAQGGGWELCFALIGMLLPLVIAGPGPLTIGRWLPLPKQAASNRPLLVLE